MIVDEEEVDEAKQWLVDNAEKIGQAKSMKVYTDEKLKIVHADVYSSVEGTIAQKNATAYTSNAYKEALLDHCKWAREDAKLMAMQAAKIQVINIWQTQSANGRYVK